MKWKLLMLVAVLVFIAFIPGSASGTNAPAATITEFKIYESSSTAFGEGTLICDITAPGDGVADYCEGVEKGKTYRVEIKLDNTGAAAGDWIDTTWRYLYSLIEDGGSVETSSTYCNRSVGSYGGAGTEAADGCSFTGGILTLADDPVPSITDGSYVWAATIFTTGSRWGGAYTYITGDIGGKTDSSDMIAVGPAPWVESYGREGYGWVQVFTNITSRLTGSADRQYYGYGYKPIQIYARLEDYWAQDCGWWYPSDKQGVQVIIKDADDNIAYDSVTYLSTSAGRREVTYNWGDSSNERPGRWNVTVQDNTTAANLVEFYLYVRGQLNVTNITTNATNALYPYKGDTVEINATLKDNAGNYINWSYWDNAGNDVTPKNVTAYITGAGEEFVINLTNYEGDGGWRGNFTPQKVGDHLIIVKASDGHQYWVDGRGSQWISVNGTYLPDYNEFASVGLWMFMRGLDGLGNKLKLSTLLASLFGVFLIRVRWGR